MIKIKVLDDCDVSDDGINYHFKKDVIYSVGEKLLELLEQSKTTIHIINRGHFIFTNSLETK